MEAKVLAIAKARLKFVDEEDELVMTYIEEVGNRIKHYCNIKDIPEELKYVWASIVQHLYFHLQQAYEGKKEGVVSSIKVGDTQVGFEQDSKNANPGISAQMVDEIILNFKADLNRYRKVRW